MTSIEHVNPYLMEVIGKCIFYSNTTNATNLKFYSINLLNYTNYSYWIRIKITLRRTKFYIKYIKLYVNLIR